MSLLPLASSPLRDIGIIIRGELTITKRSVIVCHVCLQAATADEESRTLRTLAFATTEELIDATLEFALGPNVRSQDAAGVRVER